MMGRSFQAGAYLISGDRAINLMVNGAPWQRLVPLQNSNPPFVANDRYALVDDRGRLSLTIVASARVLACAVRS